MIQGVAVFLFFESGFAGLWGIGRIGTMLCIVLTLAFDSSPIKGEGYCIGWSVLLYAPPRPPLWIADQVRNDGLGTLGLRVNLNAARRSAKIQSLVACCCPGWTWQRSL